MRQKKSYNNNILILVSLYIVLKSPVYLIFIWDSIRKLSFEVEGSLKFRQREGAERYLLMLVSDTSGITLS